MYASLEDLEKELWLRERNSGVLKWKTRDGNEIPIKDMTDIHLVNTINMLHRKEEEMDHYYDGLDAAF